MRVGCAYHSSLCSDSDKVYMYAHPRCVSLPQQSVGIAKEIAMVTI